MSTTFQPSHARIVKAEVASFAGRKYSIEAMITGFDITHSMGQVGYTGYLTVLDTVGFLENFPLRAEETLDLEIIGTDYQTRIFIKAQIIKVDGVQMAPPGDRLNYRIHFISKINYEAVNKKVILPFENLKASDVAEQVFRTYFSELEEISTTPTLPYDAKAFKIKDDNRRTFYLQPTEGELKGIIPNYTPTEAMFFLTQRSYSTNSKSSSFRFFENYDGFHYVTDEFLIRRAIDEAERAKDENRRPKYLVDLNYVASLSLEPVDAELQTRVIEYISNDNRIDSASDLISGGYANKAIEIDLIRRNMVEKSFHYLDFLDYASMDGQRIKISEDVHTEEYIAQTFNDNNAKRFMIFRDFGQTGDNPSPLRADQYYSEIVSNRLFYQHHLKNTGVTVGLKGRLDIQAGKIVRMDIAEFNVKLQRNWNEQLSGNYLVESVTHSLDQNTLRTKLKLVKYNWSKGY